ncbi:hypothetical protein MATL_G00084980 [Megalops atlanticus]|uniref:Uncharacterized protein n=1 Tax=Megalops atlanticus TaxID=7932 RepID=A0A9D3Q805_MEGAT|nr:hypothetical protein MATL_G00084980 [Megalops atlanticus]
MIQLKYMQSCCLVLLILSATHYGPVSGRCVEEKFCTRTLEEYQYQLSNIANKLNERSIAPWTYVEKPDLNRVPQVIHEAKCLTSHSCRHVASPVSLETIPLSIRVPVLRKSRSCPTYSVEYESVVVACICATPRLS